ncbi:phosphonate ABC transporter ATP-binding protein [Pseudanabaena sp. FACHB-2040]|uniref:phosphonate ABC transporter ATP-binding protein n=1 Tax=Pseudanabaena sp. FACHB-2040 TaxID=2692859 RepID=UPI001689A7BF|nr:phosphonate ABC transporter ATP-binding protein [Pseudanabaena sp. FACHB-2040]MBD2258885.1 phosphonate ABC transporter ATP-binding protein [Pseudanabaena sp. FACHB-2040]
MGEPLFELRRVSRYFGDVPALADLSLTVSAGERVALIGSSGAGKSTLLSLLNGTLPPSSGQLRVMGRDIGRLGPHQLRQVQRRIGTVYQQHHLVPNLPVIHNVNAGHLGRWSFFKAAWSLIWPQEVGRAAQALAQVGIAEKLYARTERLSGGQQQRVALARVLVQDPLVILADEPISSVDPERSREMMDLLRQLNYDTGTTLVISLHDIGFAFSHCDRILGLRHGQLLFDAPAQAVTDSMIADLYRI